MDAATDGGVQGRGQNLLVLGMRYMNLEGSWVNEFGSAMIIAHVDPKTGAFFGTYASHTGATGVYNLTGITDGAPDQNVNSQTVDFTISWRNVVLGGDEDGEHWVSGFADQVQRIDGKERMTTTYLLQHHSDPAENWGSTVVATATFQRQKIGER